MSDDPIIVRGEDIIIHVGERKGKMRHWKQTVIHISDLDAIRVVSHDRMFEDEEGGLEHRASFSLWLTLSQAEALAELIEQATA